jgi:hypothetical protein
MTSANNGNDVVDHATDIAAGVGITTPLWLHVFTPWLQLVFLLLSCTWIAIQIYHKLVRKS